VTLLEVYRDDGPLARVLGALGRAVPLPPAVLELAGLLPLLVIAVTEGDGASSAAVGLALAWLVALGGAAGGRPHTDRVRWAAPPLLRLSEYGATLYIGALAGGSSRAAAFAVICALAFRHYDLVYRSRHQGMSPPVWVSLFGLGWEGRLILGWVLLALGALPAGYFVLAALFAAVFVGESIASWLRFGQTQQPVLYDNEEEIAE
jgi:predicted outer membrane lipoprotein